MQEPQQTHLHYAFVRSRVFASIIPVCYHQGICRMPCAQRCDKAIAKAKTLSSLGEVNPLKFKSILLISTLKMDNA